MKCVTNLNPLFFIEYTSLGDSYQKTLSNNPSSNPIERTGWTIGKIVGRVQDIALNALFGITKLTLSTAIAVYSIPAAAFNYTHSHHVLAKQGSRHIALALFYVVDLPLSLANIVNKYPQKLVEKIECALELENIHEEIDASLSEAFQGISTCEKSFLKKLEQENRKLKEENQGLLKNISQQDELIHVYKQIIDAQDKKPCQEV